MAQPAAAMMTVLHLETGHVLAAASSGARTVTVDDLTGKKFLSVRLPDSTAQVNVTANLLTAATFELDEDVLGSPLAYRVDASLPTLAFGGLPTEVDTGANPQKLINAPDGTAALSLWQVGDQLEVGRSVLKGGTPDATDPAGTVGQLVACAGEPLAYGA